MGDVIDFKTKEELFNKEFWEQEKSMSLYMQVGDETDSFIASKIKHNLQQNNIGDWDDDTRTFDLEEEEDFEIHNICKSVLLGMTTSVLISVLRFFGKEMGKQIILKALRLAERTILREKRDEK